MNTQTNETKLMELDEVQLSALDEIVYRANLIESVARGLRGTRGFRVDGRFYSYYHDAAHAARLIAFRLSYCALARAKGGV